MSLDTSNIFDKFRSVNPPAYSGRTSPANSYPATKPMQNDSYSFTNGMGENLSYNPEKSIAGAVFDGTLNDKNAEMKVISDRKDTYYEGKIGDKKVLLMQKNKNITGTYGGKEVNITFDYNQPSAISKFFNCTLRGRVFKPDYFNISGTIGGKPMSINLPNAEIPTDDDERDMISLALLDCGLEARTFGNKIIGIGYSNHCRSNIIDSKQNRDKKIDENVKPIVMQSISMIASVAVGALLARIGLKP